MSNGSSYHQGLPSSYATRGHSSLSGGGGGGDCSRNLRSGYLGDKESVLSRRNTALTTANPKESWSRGDQYFGGSKRNDTSTSLKASPQLNLRTENSFNFSQEGHHPNVSRALPKNYCIDSCYTIPTTTGRLGQKYGRDRERMKDELANSNSMARTGSGILPGGIVGLAGRSHLLWRETRSDTNSSIPKPEMYSSNASAVTGTISTPSLLPAGAQSRFNNENSHQYHNINDNNNNSRVSSLISEAQKAKDVLRSNLADTNNQFQDRLNSYTRPTASWNSVGIGSGNGGGGMTMTELDKERNGNKKLQQDAYRASLERQVEQKSKRIAEEERKFNSHPFGPSYEQPKPTFWQSSMRTGSNQRPEDISIQKRVLAQNSSTRISQYEVPHERVSQARTNLQNSRTSPDTYHQQYNNNINNRNVGRGGGSGGYNGNHYTTTAHTTPKHHLSNQSSSANGYNFRAHASPLNNGNNDIPPEQQHRLMKPEGMHVHFPREPVPPQAPYRDLRYPSNNGFNNNEPYPPQRHMPPANNIAPHPHVRQPFYPPHNQPQPPTLPNFIPVPTAVPGYQYLQNYPNGAYQPAYLPYQPAVSLPPPNPYYQHQQPPVGPRLASYGSVHQQQQQYPPQHLIRHPNSYPFYENREQGGGGDFIPQAYESHRRSNEEEDDLIQQRIVDIQRQMHVDQDDNNNNTNSSSWRSSSYQDHKKGNPLKPSKSMLYDVDRLRNFVEDKLVEKNVDFDELREVVFGRPNNWKTTDNVIDLKPIKDIINRAELSEQIKINHKKKAIQAAKEKEEEDKLERKIQEYYDVQKQREQNAQKDEWSRLHNRNKKAVSKNFLAKENYSQIQIPSVAPVQPKNKKTTKPPRRPEHPEQSLARKIRNREKSETRYNDEFESGDHQHDDHYQRDQEEYESDYSYAKYMEKFNRDRPPSPPVPALLPKSNEETLKGKLSKTTFSRPRLSPSILNARSSDLRSRIEMEKNLKGKFSNPEF